MKGFLEFNAANLTATPQIHENLEVMSELIESISTMVDREDVKTFPFKMKLMESIRRLQGDVASSKRGLEKLAIDPFFLRDRTTSSLKEVNFALDIISKQHSSR